MTLAIFTVTCCTLSYYCEDEMLELLLLIDISKASGLDGISGCILLNKAFIRPNLECACQVWGPHLKKDIAALESVQKLVLGACGQYNKR